MKKATTLSLSLIAVAATTGLLVLKARRKRQMRMRQEIADEGYETAQDILYPRRSDGWEGIYGPVLPH